MLMMKTDKLIKEKVFVIFNNIQVCAMRYLCVYVYVYVDWDRRHEKYELQHENRSWECTGGELN